MDDTRLHVLVLYGAVRCAAVGLLVGALEAFTLAVTVKLPLGLLGFLAIAAGASASFGLLGFVLGVLIGIPVHLGLRRFVVSRGLAAQLALTSGVLLGTLFLGFALEEWHDGRAWASIFLGLFPLFLVGVVFLLASRLFRLAELGQSSPLPFLPVAAGATLLAWLGAAGLVASKDTGGSGALDSDPRFVVVMVDSLRADLGSARTPAFDRLAASGVVFTDAVTPAPATGPAVASLLTGLPPLRHQVLRDGDRLRRVRALLPATFADEGYATGGFVSSAALGHDLGFDYGFHVYDDDLGSPMAGLGRLRLVGVVSDALGLEPETRAGSVTVDRFLGWLDGHDQVPFFAVIHLQEPREPLVPHGLEGFGANGTPEAPLLDHRARLGEQGFDEGDTRVLRRLYQEEVAVVDRELGRILDALDARSLTDRTVVIVVGTGGELLGEHAGAFTHRGLWDETVRVPLLVRLPGGPTDASIAPQVRIQDLYPTILLHAELEARHQPEAIPLVDYLDGSRTRPLWSSLVGRDTDGEWLIGARNNGLKYLRRLRDGQERLYDVTEDPAETEDLAQGMPQKLEDARSLVAGEARALAKQLGVPLAPVGE